MNSRVKDIFLWISVLPGALIGGILMTFPLHWVLYGTLVNGSVISGVDIESIERFLSPFVIALSFVLVGTYIAPDYKFKTAVVLTIFYVVSFLALFVFASGMVTFELRGAGALIGVLLGLFVVWKKYRTGPSASAQAREIN